MITAIYIAAATLAALSLCVYLVLRKDPEGLSTNPPGGLGDPAVDHAVR